MRLLSVRPGATVLLLVVTLLIARASLSNPHTPAAAQGTVPTATATPDPTVLPTAPSDVHDAQDQLDGLFSQIEGDPPPSSDVETLASRLVGIDFGQLANAIESPVGPKDPVTGIPQTPHKLVLNLFADVVLTGIVEHVEPTASGHALWGGLEGVELGTMTLVVNGSVVVGTVRTPDAVYTIRTAAAGAYVVRQIDESSLPPLGEPLRGSIPEPDSPPPVRPQVRGPDAPDGTSTPTSTPTPVPTVPTSPSKPAPDEAMASGLFSEVEGDPPPSSDVETLASRLVGIDFGQLANAIESPVGPKDPVTGIPQTPHKLVLNLFADVVLTGIVEHVEPTASGHVLWGSLDGVELGTMTLVVNGKVVVGTVRTPNAVYTIRTAGDGTYVIRQIDESSLPPLGEPLVGPLPPPDAQPPVPQEGRDPTEPVAPDGTSTPTPTPVSTVPTAPSDADDDEARPGGLFSDVEGDPPPSTDVETITSRLVGIDFGQLAQAIESPVGPKDPTTGKPTTPQTLVLNLFKDVVFTGIVEHIEPTSSGHALWGRLDGVELGTMTMVVNGSVVVGTVRTTDAVYTIRTAGDGTYVIRQIDESTLPPLGEPLEDPLSTRDPHPYDEPLEGPLSTPEARSDSNGDQSDDGSVIDMMVAYTPAAKTREGGRAAIEALIDLFVAETNQAYANSGVIHRIKLVFVDEVDYIEDGDSNVDLSRLRRDSNGYMDRVHELRDKYAADLVHLVVNVGDVCGLAYLNRGEVSAEREIFGFALTVVYCGGLTFAHELGHNMGLHHDRYEVGLSFSVGRVPLIGSHYGYVNQKAFEPDAPEDTRWRTIMSYNLQCSEVGSFGCDQLPYFSNPELTYNGDPMGVPVDNPSTGVDGPADGVGSLNERREITANFRRSSASPTPRVRLTMSPYWLSENGGVSTVTATLHRPSSADTSVELSASPSNAVTLSGSRMLIIPAGDTVSVDSLTITGVDNGELTGDRNVTISATAANASSLGVIEPEPVALMIADDETTPVVTLSLSPAEIVELEGRTLVTATLDNRSGAGTTVTVSATPADVVEEIYGNTLTIPAGQRASVGFGVGIYPLDDAELTEARKSVTVSGTATNSQGVTGPDSVTLTIIDDEAPFFANDSIAYTFTEGVGGAASCLKLRMATGN